jgi:transcriptional regulator with XRE-family HTH domain
MSNDIFLKQMGARITKARKTNKMTLQQLSDLSGINISNLWFLENGQRNAHILSLKSIADVLKVDVKEFI